MSFLNNEISQDDFLNQNNITLQLVKMPGYIYGFIYKHKDNILIAINNQISKYKQQITFLHELAHFELKHTELNFLEFKLEDIEDEADEYVKYLISLVKTC